MATRPRDGVKDRILNARIPEELDRELRQQADRLEMPVSQLVRGILQRTVDLVGNFSGNVEHLVTEVVEDVAGFRDTVEAVTQTGRQQVLEQILAWQPIRNARLARCFATGRVLTVGADAWIGIREDGRPGPVVAQDALDTLLASQRLQEDWSPIRLHRRSVCADTGEELPVGTEAWLEKGSRPPVILSRAAMEARRRRASGEASADHDPPTPDPEDDDVRP
jgi:hypothetical protein